MTLQHPRHLEAPTPELTFNRTAKPLRRATQRDDVFDYVIVGAGAAGSVLANRLSEDPNNRVLLLECGGRDRNPIIYVPKGFIFTLRGNRYTYHHSTQPVGSDGQFEVCIEASDSELGITGEIKKRERKGALRRRPRRTGRFEYGVMLPGDVDTQNIDVSLSDGVLTVRIPKPEHAKPRQVEIKS